MLIGYSPRLMASLIRFTFISSIGADDDICLIDEGTSADFSSTLSLAFAAAAGEALVASCDNRSETDALRGSIRLTVFLTIPTMLVEDSVGSREDLVNAFAGPVLRVPFQHSSYRDGVRQAKWIADKLDSGLPILPAHWC